MIIKSGFRLSYNDNEERKNENYKNCDSFEEGRAIGSVARMVDGECW